MVRAVFDELGQARPRHGFTVGIMDDVTRTSLTYDPEFDLEPADTVRAVFFGLGADGTVGANKNSIKIIGEDGDRWVQGFFVYDSKKSGAITISHLRFGPRPIRSPYLIHQASFVACHQFVFLDRYDMLRYAAPGATFLVNSPYSADQLYDQLPREVQQAIQDRKLRVFTINAEKVARDTGMGNRINTIMQTCFFALSGVMPRDEAIAAIKQAITKTYKKKGDDVVRKNVEAVDGTLANLHEVPIPGRVTATRTRPPLVSPKAPDFVQRVTAVMLAGDGDLLPVSAFPVGTRRSASSAANAPWSVRTRRSGPRPTRPSISPPRHPASSPSRARRRN
jgi:pyruvate-ferredoxin/flavodoxin oxidoreductase